MQSVLEVAVLVLKDRQRARTPFSHGKKMRKKGRKKILYFNLYILKEGTKKRRSNQVSRERHKTEVWLTIKAA